MRRRAEHVHEQHAVRRPSRRVPVDMATQLHQPAAGARRGRHHRGRPEGGARRDAQRTARPSGECPLVEVWGENNIRGGVLKTERD